MPIILNDEQRALLASGAVAVRTLIDFYLDSGRQSFWDGDFAWIPNGEEDGDWAGYLPAADFGEISAVSLGKDLGAEGVEIRLNGTRLLEANPDVGDPAAIFGTIEQENYQLRRCSIRFAFFDPATGAQVFVVTRFAGFIDQIRQQEEVGDDGVMTSWLIVSLESIARRYGVRGGRTRSHDDQQDIWPGDTFFKFTGSTIEKEGTLYWGRDDPRARAAARRAGQVNVGMIARILGFR